jgi:hypothetical protein
VAVRPPPRKVFVIHQRLGNLAELYGGVYLFVDLVALGTSGPDLIRDPGAWYSMLAPPMFAGVCLFVASVRMTSRRLLRLGIVAHLLVAPAIYDSMLGLGFLLPVLSYQWWRAYVVTRNGELHPTGR